MHRIVSASVRDMLDAYRIQAQTGPVTDKALEAIIFRAAHGVVQSLAPYPGEQRVALLPRVVRMLLATFLENVAAADASVRISLGHATTADEIDRAVGLIREIVPRALRTAATT